jgi:hypothetical protein
MVRYRIEYGPYAHRALELKTPERKREIEMAIQRWAQTPPVDPTKRAKYRIPIPEGTATCRVEPDTLVYVITILSID